MTIKYNDVYIKDTYTISGTYEADGPLRNYIDKIYPKDLYFGEKTLEKAEIKMQTESIKELLKKNRLDNNIDLLIAGDLQNQIAASSYTARNFNIPFLGIYSACSTIAEGISIASSFFKNKNINNIVVATSSHNMVAEKQFRNPSEYGAPKHKTATFTATGACSILLTNKKTSIKIESSTIGRVIDKGVTDVNNMGAVMAPAAADTIYRHLHELKRSPNYYDLILTGDLGVYGKKILIDYMKKVYKLDISKNYNDCGTMLFDTQKQPVYAGASGPVCSGLVGFGYIYKEMIKHRYKRVLIVPTGALFSPTLLFQKESIPTVSHAIGIEVVE